MKHSSEQHHWYLRECCNQGCSYEQEKSGHLTPEARDQLESIWYRCEYWGKTNYRPWFYSDNKLKVINKNQCRFKINLN